jgi:hypothetical protein
MGLVGPPQQSVSGAPYSAKFSLMKFLLQYFIIGIEKLDFLPILECFSVLLYCLSSGLLILLFRNLRNKLAILHRTTNVLQD